MEAKAMMPDMACVKNACSGLKIDKRYARDLKEVSTGVWANRYIIVVGDEFLFHHTGVVRIFDPVITEKVAYYSSKWESLQNFGIFGFSVGGDESVSFVVGWETHADYMEWKLSA